MKRKIALAFLSFALLAGTAYAARPSITLWVNGQQIASPVAPMNQNGSVMVPLRAVSEALGASATWDATNQRVNIQTPPAAPQGLTITQLNKIGESVGFISVLNASGQQISTASGFVAKPNVFITNVHVIQGATTLKVTLGENTYSLNVADAFAKNEQRDLVAFKIDATNAVKISTEMPEPDDRIYTIGWPKAKYMLGGAVYAVRDDYFTHSALQKPGSSGGIVINSNGEVIGVSRAGDQYVNSAIPIKYAQELINQ